MRSPAYAIRTRGPKKSPATTDAVSVALASRARSSAVRIPRLPPSASRGRAYGVFGLVTGLAALPASAGFGWVWDHYGSEAAFLMGSSIAWFSAAALFLFLPGRRK